MPVNTPKSPVAWMVWKAAVRQNVYSLTYQTKDASGKPAVIYDSIVGPHTFTLSRELTAEQARAFNPWNMLRATPDGKVDDWDPANAREKYENGGSDVFRIALIINLPCRRACAPANASPMKAHLPTLSRQATRQSAREPRESRLTASVQPRAPPIHPSSMDKPIQNSSRSAPIPVNHSPSPATTPPTTPNTLTVRATAANGFYVTSHIYVEPTYIDPPSFTRKPVIAAPANSKISVNYALNLGGRDDESIIDWYICDDAQCGILSRRREVAVSRGNQPLRQLCLRPDSPESTSKPLFGPSTTSAIPALRPPPSPPSPSQRPQTSSPTSTPTSVTSLKPQTPISSAACGRCWAPGPLPSETTW